MIVGVPKEIKVAELRVGLKPPSIRELVRHGQEVIVESGAGFGVGVADTDYEAAGATIISSAADIFATADMVVKVKEPQPQERAMLRKNQILFTYLHLAPDPDQAKDLVASGAICIAYETVTDNNGGLPLLAPMSRVAGRLSVQAGATALESVHGGSGILLGGIAGVAPANVVVIGGGVVGENAIDVALGMGANVTLLDNNVDVLDKLGRHFGPALTTIYSTATALDEEVIDADLVIGAVLVKGARAPKLVTADMVPRMRPGSVLVDVAIDQGGCFETSHPTTHTEPTYIVDDTVHYCVANMPGAVPKTSTAALNTVTLPRALALATKGVRQALTDDPHLRNGLNVCGGLVTDKAVASELGYEYTDPMDALSSL
ncbi:MAG: alanine dehydrogenase [Acidimicrobiia bacterium]|nr:alanine dehydrogenase [Acidimicrobiia bacterium]MDX2468693.1 alanine dehydrogenase [Acidimicrobiia bacterium]